jgi:serine/threonine protein kinase
VAEQNEQQPDAWQQTLHTQLPELEDDIELAINTLKKLQRVTGSGSKIISRGAPQLDLRSEAAGSTIDTSVPDTSQTIIGDPAADAPAGAKKARTLAAGETFGRYQIARRLGEGAMGAVYLAYDPQLERYVAIKTPFVGSDPAVIKGFYREARSAAQVRSPYVCPIYEVDSVGGVLFLSMAFIEGQPLSKWIHGDEPHTLDDVAWMFYKIASGVQRAHAQGVIHRDLKPDNVMVDTDGEPVIMDFGLARRLDDEIRLTAQGEISGTPAYMSPEQVRGNPDEIGPQSDVYSLGVVLYEMLTGGVPFQGQLMSVLHKVVNEEPQPPSAVQPALPAGAPIEQICLKMMAKGQAERYESMTAVLDDVQLVLRQFASPDAPSTANKEPLLKSFWKRSRNALATLAGFRTQAPPLSATIRTHENGE